MNQHTRSLELWFTQTRHLGALRVTLPGMAVDSVAWRDLFLHGIALNRSLHTLRLEGSLGDQGAAALAHALHRESPLRTLVLYHSEIGGLGIRSLAIALQTGCPLLFLALKGSQFGDEGLLGLAPALGSNTTLQRLMLCDAGIGRLCSTIALTLVKPNRGQP